MNGQSATTLIDSKISEDHLISISTILKDVHLSQMTEIGINAQSS
jgi:hypothetical protein